MFFVGSSCKRPKTNCASSLTGAPFSSEPFPDPAIYWDFNEGGKPWVGQWYVDGLNVLIFSYHGKECSADSFPFCRVSNLFEIQPRDDDSLKGSGLYMD